MLGFKSEADQIANDLSSSDNRKCREVSNKYLESNFNDNLVNFISESIENSVDHISNVRKGFFCMVCDAQSHKELSNYWVSLDEKYKERMYFSKSFCRRLVNEQI